MRDGRRWAVAARKWSIDRTTNRQGGRLRAFELGRRGPTVDRVVFSAQRGELVGPVRTPLGFAIFKVTAIHPAHRRSLTQARASIRRTLFHQRRQQAWARFVADFAKRWRKHTRCAPDLSIADCHNRSG